MRMLKSLDKEQINCIESAHSAVQLLKGKWTYYVIIDLLMNDIKRFNQLKSSLGNVNTKALTDTLRFLEGEGMLIRTVYPTVPATVEYELTLKGKDFGRILQQMKDWNDKWEIKE